MYLELGSEGGRATQVRGGASRVPYRGRVARAAREGPLGCVLLYVVHQEGELAHDLLCVTW
jgi:hypothetical protein